MRMELGKSAFVTSTALALLVGFVAVSAISTPAVSLGNGKQLLSGGGTMSASGDPRFTAPGYTNQLTDTFPGPGLAESATQLRMSAGTLSDLRVKVTTATAPSSGELTVMVRINGKDTKLNCSIDGTGKCKSKKGKVETINDKAELAVLVSNNFVGSGNLSYTYTLIYD